MKIFILFAVINILSFSHNINAQDLFLNKLVLNVKNDFIVNVEDLKLTNKKSIKVNNSIQFIYNKSISTVPLVSIDKNINNYKLSIVNLNRISIPLHKFEESKKSSLFVPVSEVILLNLLVGFYNEKFPEEEWAKINKHTMETNFKRGFDWDNDKFRTNFFEHPYHGSLYFNSARSNGYSFLESVPFSLGGSLMWEYIMENTRPAWNDLINTTASGYMLGEITHRLSNIILKRKGANIVGNIFLELGSFLINPMQFVNRLGRKELDNKYVNKNESVEKSFDDLFFYTGYSKLYRFDDKDNAIIGGIVNYGDVFNTNENNRKPFGVFRINFNINFGSRRETINNINAYALLYGKNRNLIGDKSLIGFFQHYDFAQNLAYKFGGISFGGGVISKYEMRNNSKIITRIFLNLMPLGASNSIFRKNEEKDYSFSYGANSKIEGRYEYLWFRFYLAYDIYWFHIFNLANNGNTGNELIQSFRPKILAKVFNNFYLGSEFIYYKRNGYYDLNIQPVRPFLPVNELRIFIGYSPI